MPCEPSLWPSVISAASGLSGVALGGWLTSLREGSKERTRVKKELSYLAILVVAHLDRFVNGCLHVAYDDGTREGMPASDDRQFHQATADAPTFDPLSLDVDWKVLPADLMYETLNLPYEAEQLANHIASVGEYDDPPEYTSYFWARQQGYASLGLEVSALIHRIRQHAALPIPKPLKGDMTRDESLKEQIDRVNKERTEYEARVAASGPLI